MMRYVKLIKLLVLMLLFYGKATAYDINAPAHRECPMTIVIPSYNNEKWYEKNLQSVVHQHYKNYRIIYVNDCSPDDTCALVEEYLKTQHIEYRKVDFDPQDGASIESIVDSFSAIVNQEMHFFTLVNNKKRAGALANLYRMIHSCRNKEIIVSVDGDDWL